MNYLAVVFDLFGTLADNFSSNEYEEILVQMASVLNLSSEDFKRGWFDNSRARNPEVPQNLEDRVAYICGKLGAPREKQQISYATRIRFEYIRHVMESRSDAVQVILALRQKGYKIGLISDCSDEIPVIWPQTPLAPLFDATVFSCLVGFRKPDSRIYQLGAAKLNVPLEQCLFVGDGGSQELSGALKAGMHPVLFRLDDTSTERHLSDREPWNGPTIHSLSEVLTLLSAD